MSAPLLPAQNRPRWLRGLRQTGGFLLIFTGLPLLITPLPVAPAIVLGLNLLKDDYAFARRLLDRTRTLSAQLRQKYSTSSLRATQANLRKQLMAPRQWIWQRASLPSDAKAPAASGPSDERPPSTPPPAS